MVYSPLNSFILSRRETIPDVGKQLMVICLLKADGGSRTFHHGVRKKVALRGVLWDGKRVPGNLYPSFKRNQPPSSDEPPYPDRFFLAHRGPYLDRVVCHLDEFSFVVPLCRPFCWPARGIRTASFVILPSVVLGWRGGGVHWE